jgi:hypothetical protein
MKLRIRRRRLDILVLLGSITAALGFSASLYLDIHTSSRLEDQDPIGILVMKKRVAQRRFGDRVVWAPLETEEPVYSMDAIRTEEGSEALIRLKDDTELFLSGNSMVVLDFSGRTGAIEFIEGSIVARRADATASSLQIRADGAQLDVGAGTVDLARGDDKAVSIGVSGGEVVLRSKDGARTLAASDSTSLSAGTARVVQTALVQEGPAAGSVVFGPGPAVAVRFSWSASGVQPPFTLETSRTRDFSTRETMETRENNVLLPLEPGSWFWRVTDSSGTSTRTLAFSVLADQPPNALEPVDRQTLQFRTAAPSIRLGWQAVPSASSYEYELADEPGFGFLVRSGRSAINWSMLEALSEGSYYWRVRARFDYAGIGAGSWSESRSFILEPLGRLPPPRLTSPLADDSYDVASPDAMAMFFAWETVPGAVAYELDILGEQAVPASQVAINQTEAKPGEERISWTGRQNFVRLDRTLPAGTYRWRVRATDARDELSDWQESRSFTIVRRPLPVALAPTDGLSVEAGSVVTIVWQGPYEASVIVSARPDLSDPVQIVAGTANKASLRLDNPGLYYWALAALGASSELVQAGSPAAATLLSRSIHVLQPLPRPLPLLPGRGEALRLDSAGSVAFSWEPVPEATAYGFILRQADGATLEQKELSQTRLTLPAAWLPAGNYVWTVRAIARSDDRPEASGPASSSSFSVVTARNPPAARLVAPAAGEGIDGLQSLRDGIRLAWSQSESGSTYTVKVEKTGDGLVWQGSTGALSIVFPDPGPGSYRWTLGGQAPDGVPLPEAGREFRVLPIPPLDGAAILFPRAGTQVDVTNADFIRFSWSRVNGATTYQLALKSAGNNRILFSRLIDGGTELVYRELENLDTGSFILSVKPLAMNSKGVIERSGPEQSADFNIFIRTGSAPALLSPREIYVQNP